MDVYVSIRFKFQRNLGWSPWKMEKERKWRKVQENGSPGFGGILPVAS